MSGSSYSVRWLGRPAERWPDGRWGDRSSRGARTGADVHLFEAGVVVRGLEVVERFCGEALGCAPVRRSHISRAIAGSAGLGGQLLVV